MTTSTIHDRAGVLQRIDFRRRSRAAGIHLSISAVVASLAAALVFGLWYPAPYHLLSGGRELFFLVTSVDAVLGPVLTFVAISRGKSRAHLKRDLAVIGAIQVAALIYGLHTVFIVRPVTMVFEVDRFRVISAASVHVAELPQARPEYRRLPLTGPWLLAAREPRPGDEQSQAILLAIDGIDVGQRPPFWEPYAQARVRALARARPVAELLERYPEQRALILERGGSARGARFLPLMARGDWVALLDARGDLAGVAPLDGFF